MRGQAVIGYIIIFGVALIITLLVVDYLLVTGSIDPCYGIENITTHVSIRQEVFDDFKMENKSLVYVKLNSVVSYTGDEIEDMILETLTEEDFQLERIYTGSSAFHGVITCSGLRKLASDSRVKSIKDYYSVIGRIPEIEITPWELEIDIQCVLNDNDFINVTIKNKDARSIMNGTVAFTIYTAEDELLGTEITSIPTPLGINETTVLSMTIDKGILVEGETYRVKITMSGGAEQTAECVAQAGEPQ